MPIEAPTGVTPAVLGDLVFFGTEAGTLFGVNWKEAKVAWKVEDKAPSQPMRSSPAVQRGDVGRRRHAQPPVQALQSGHRRRAVGRFRPSSGSTARR